jgi:replication-associated recombination protein RarA
MDCLPPWVGGRWNYKPSDRGFEKEIKRRLEGWERVKAERKKK